VRFDRDDVRRIAALARLSLADEELDRFAGQLASVLEHVAALDSIESGSAAADIPEAAPAREDHESFDPPVLPPASFAPEFEDGFFSVPRLPAFDVERDAPDGGI
jgi:aspartyl-tRNA(Asn)/glutamyl-tRNA(Gln) amidotransferase subunit C